MEFKAQVKKMLPLILLVDTSGSMENCIGELNNSIEEMLKELNEQQSLRAEIHISFITFGNGGASLHTPLTPIKNIVFQRFVEGGMTPLGGALKIAKDMIEDRDVIPSNSYKPTIIMLSDGGPNDNWEKPFVDFVQNGRTQKCERISLGIGINYIHEILEKFSSDKRVFKADEAKNIPDFFKFVTMTMKEKSISETPNKVVVDTSSFFDLLNEENKIVKDRVEEIDEFRFDSDNLDLKEYFNL
ncbi:MAG: vWA domain-containing protein [Fusobacteriaceae bacterium]